ncbi:hypothetical protein WOLCODRAFT_155651 [Wolfiporia cocos MD-104 SS10]|uniref:DUF862-domain-containing protein n=1 Tax=Wolfiporia cocos (strain MD-104) TaxID=742152 RepID=A0A2H3IZ49_WOLCO|nr:hypothetical protein WOLCODRAFT_155651 [Wolfiporia cocos MD-104 SS10]
MSSSSRGLVLISGIARSSLASLLILQQLEHVSDFWRHVCASEEKLKGHWITSVASYKSESRESPVVTATNGAFGHQFIVATIFSRDDQHPDGINTYIRVDFWGEGHFGNYSIAQTVVMSDKVTELTKEAREVGRLAAPVGLCEGGPTLREFASLLNIIYARTHRYDLFSRNCMWHTELILYCTARRYAHHWLAGTIRPEPLRKYVSGECDALTCTVELNMSDPAARWFSYIGITAVRHIQSFFTASQPGRIYAYEEDIKQFLEIWN